MTHAHAHTGAAGHGSAAAGHRGRLAIALLASLGILAVDVVGGVVSNSLALLADAGHVLTDVAGMALALGAITFAGRTPTEKRTFGFLRLEILAALANGLLMFGIAGFVLFEAWNRLTQPPEVRSGVMLLVAAVALVVNAALLFLLHRAQQESLNMRGAYLEVLGDLLGSVAVIAAALVISVTGWTVADAVASAFIGLFILPRAFNLLRQAVDVLLEGTPQGLDLPHLRKHILDAPGVQDCHDLHVWTITSGTHALSAHVVLAEGADPDGTLDALSSNIAHHFDITHSTFQLETKDRREVGEHVHV
jgi:cobalt-zinc-cadmium efflux system protein